jgi:hypothetical protein
MIACEPILAAFEQMTTHEGPNSGPANSQAYPRFGSSGPKQSRS